MIGIYQIKNKTTGKSYIGQSVQVDYRLNKHKTELSNDTHRNLYLQNAFSKYGIDDFEFKPLIECSRNDLDFYEDLLINEYKSNLSEFGYNLRKVSSSNAGIITTRSKHKSGDKYFRLTLIEPSLIPGSSGSWICKCECDNIVIVKPSQIIRGHNKSCGCLNKEQQLNRHKRISGEKYGRWTLIEKLETRKGCAWWTAQCDCGTIKEVNIKYLLNGNSQSCGCLRKEVTTKRNLLKGK